MTIEAGFGTDLRDLRKRLKVNGATVASASPYAGPYFPPIGICPAIWTCLRDGADEGRELKQLAPSHASELQDRVRAITAPLRISPGQPTP
jgi:hypothetical protein